MVSLSWKIKKTDNLYYLLLDGAVSNRWSCMQVNSHAYFSWKLRTSLILRAAQTQNESIHADFALFKQNQHQTLNWNHSTAKRRTPISIKQFSAFCHRTPLRSNFFTFASSCTSFISYKLEKNTYSLHKREPTRVTGGGKFLFSVMTPCCCQKASKCARYIYGMCNESASGNISKWVLFLWKEHDFSHDGTFTWYWLAVDPLLFAKRGEWIN